MTYENRLDPAVAEKAFQTYQMYLALQFHFKSDTYDFFKYNGKVNCKRSTFDTKNDRYYYYKISRQSDPKNYLLAHFIELDKFWIGSHSVDVFQKWQARQEALSYIFECDLNQLDPLKSIESNFFIHEENVHPEIFKMVTGGHMCIETVVILNMIAGGKILQYWKKHEKLDPIFQQFSLKCRKYAPFLKLDREKYRDIFHKFKARHN